MGEPTVLLRRSALGDVVLLGGVTGAIEGPVTVVTATAWVPVAERLVGVDRVVPWPKDLPDGELAAQIGPGRVVDLHGTPRSRRLARALGGAVATVDKRSLARRLRLVWGRGPVRPDVPSLYGEALGVSPREAPWIHLPAAERTALALVPGASVPTKQWTAEGFARVGRGWDGPVLVLGGPGEEATCDAVAREVPGAEVVCESGFDRTFGALARTEVCVSGDTGLMHLAAACGATVVGLFGPTHPDDGFWVHRGEVVQRVLGCRPCSLHGRERCPLRHHRCMAIDPATVVAAVARVRP